eukprot:5116166-Amphidinium_carterae.2
MESHDQGLELVCMFCLHVVKKVFKREKSGSARLGCTEQVPCSETRRPTPAMNIKTPSIVSRQFSEVQRTNQTAR